MQRPTPHDACAAVAAMYRAWATARRLAIDERDGMRVRGLVEGVEVVVDPGTDRGLPIWVEARIGCARSRLHRGIITRRVRAPGATASALRRLFDDPALGPELRAIAVGKEIVRIHLAPGASPAVVELAVAAVARVVG